MVERGAREARERKRDDDDIRSFFPCGKYKIKRNGKFFSQQLRERGNVVRGEGGGRVVVFCDVSFVVVFSAFTKLIVFVLVAFFQKGGVLFITTDAIIPGVIRAAILLVLPLMHFHGVVGRGMFFAAALGVRRRGKICGSGSFEHPQDFFDLRYVLDILVEAQIRRGGENKLVEGRRKGVVQEIMFFDIACVFDRRVKADDEPDVVESQLVFEEELARIWLLCGLDPPVCDPKVRRHLWYVCVCVCVSLNRNLTFAFFILFQKKRQMTNVNVWIDDCVARVGKRCLFISKGFSVAMLAATCSCPGGRSCFDASTSSLTSYSVFGGTVLSAQSDYLSADVELHPAILPGGGEEVTVEACASDVVFAAENTQVSGANAVVYEVVSFSKPLLKPPRPPSPPRLLSPPPPSPPPPRPSDFICTDDCLHFGDGECDDGGEGALYGLCDYGTDCVDCAARSPRSVTVTAASHFIACGRSNFARCGEEERFALDSELHEVRCCADAPRPGWSKRDGCGAWANSVVGGTCHHSKTFGEASAICASESARLCTREEIEEDCTVGTGCGHDRDLVWTSSSA